MSERLCVNCEAAPVRRRLRCAACAAYRDKYGTDRPFRVMVRQWRREDQRRHEQRAC